MTSWSWAGQEVNSIQFARNIGLTNVVRLKSVSCNMRPVGFIRDMVVSVTMEYVQLLHNNLLLAHLRGEHHV